MRRSGWLPIGLLLAACQAPASPDAGPRPALDIFIVAADDVPGGTWTSAWFSPGLLRGAFDATAYFTTGYVRTPPERVPGTASRGRLIRFVSPDFETVCSADFPLRTVSGFASTVFAAGDDRRIVMYRPMDRQCELSPGPDVAAARWYASASDEHVLVLAGGSSNDLGGLLFEFDGAGWHRANAPRVLTSIRAVTADGAGGFWAVGDEGLVLRRWPGTNFWTGYDYPASGSIIAVGTESQTNARHTIVVEAGHDSIFDHSELGDAWVDRPLGDADFHPSAVFINGREDFVVGADGAQSVFNGAVFYRSPLSPLTHADLFFVTGGAGQEAAGGSDEGRIGEPEPGAVLLRGDREQSRYRLDGIEYTPRGHVRLDFGSTRYDCW